MCFYNDDYDWCAELSEVTEADSGPELRCDECGRVIGADEWRKHIWQQEHEMCQLCEDEDSDDYVSELDRDEGPCEHDYGETFEYDRCRGCDRLIKGIEAVEIAEGCPEHARKPDLTSLADEMREHSNRWDYAEKAVEMFPELIDHPIVARMLIN